MARPNLSYLKNLILAALGLGAGAWTGLTGMSTAPVAGPLLTWLVGLRDQRLGGATLVVTMVSAFVGLLAYSQGHWVSLPAALVFAVASTAGALLGSPLGGRWSALPASRAVWGALTVALGLGLPSVAALSRLALGADAAPHAFAVTAATIGPLIGAGLASGLLGRLANLGGVLVVPALLIVTRGDAHLAAATALAALVLVSALPSLSYTSRRVLPGQVALWCGLGAALGALIGSRAAVGLSSREIVAIYAAGLVVIGAVRLLGVAFPPKSEQRAGPAAAAAYAVESGKAPSDD